MERARIVIAVAFATLVAGCERPAPPATPDAGADTSAMGRAAPPAPTPPPPLLTIASADGAGQYLVDGVGRSLYVFDKDLAASACSDECARRWPALVAPDGVDAPVAPPVQAGSVGRVTRPDGALQVTYFKRPLYLYIGDSAPGQRTGHDLTDEFGHWSLVAPDGQPLEVE